MLWPLQINHKGTAVVLILIFLLFSSSNDAQVGVVTILVNNAGIVSGKKLLETSDETYNHTFIYPYIYDLNEHHLTENHILSLYLNVND